MKEQYLQANPFNSLPKVDDARAPMDVTGRTLTHAQWRFVLQTARRPLEASDFTAAAQRDYFALLFAYATGLRRAELATATTGAPVAQDAGCCARGRLVAQGQRQGCARARRAYAPRLMEALAALLQLRPVPSTVDTAPKGTPLIAHLKTGEPLAPDALARLYKAIFMRAADALRVRYPGAAADLERASTHWLRHTHANHALDAGSDLRDVQIGLGHASLATTTIYTKGDAVRQYQAVERFFDSALDSTTSLTSL